MIVYGTLPVVSGVMIIFTFLILLLSIPTGIYVSKTGNRSIAIAVRYNFTLCQTTSQHWQHVMFVAHGADRTCNDFANVKRIWHFSRCYPKIWRGIPVALPGASNGEMGEGLTIARHGARLCSQILLELLFPLLNARRKWKIETKMLAESISRSSYNTHTHTHTHILRFDASYTRVCKWGCSCVRMIHGEGFTIIGCIKRNNQPRTLLSARLVTSPCERGMHNTSWKSCNGVAVGDDIAAESWQQWWPVLWL